MCGRYYLDIEMGRDIKEIIDEIKQIYCNRPELKEMKSGEIFPADIVPIIISGRPVLMKWGFSRYDGKGQIINARLETAVEKPTFRKAFMEHRCLIPASYFFEWEKCGTGKKKYLLGLKEPIYMAGLYRQEEDFSLPKFVILTRPAAPHISFIHDRMPVILAKEMHEAWLSQYMEKEGILSDSIEKLAYQLAD